MRAAISDLAVARYSPQLGFVDRALFLHVPVSYREILLLPLFDVLRRGCRWNEVACCLLCLFAVSDSGSLDIKELVDNYHILVQHSLHGEELLDAFNKLDTNKDGYLSLPELKVSNT